MVAVTAVAPTGAILELFGSKSELADVVVGD